MLASAVVASLAVPGAAGAAKKDSASTPPTGMHCEGGAASGWTHTATTRRSSRWDDNDNGWVCSYGKGRLVFKDDSPAPAPSAGGCFEHIDPENVYSLYWNGTSELGSATGYPSTHGCQPHEEFPPHPTTFIIAANYEAALERCNELGLPDTHYHTPNWVDAPENWYECYESYY